VQLTFSFDPQFAEFAQHVAPQQIALQRTFENRLDKWMKRTTFLRPPKAGSSNLSEFTAPEHATIIANPLFKNKCR